MRSGTEAIGGKLCHVCSLSGLNDYAEEGRWLFTRLEHPPIVSKMVVDSDVAFNLSREDGRGSLPNLRGVLTRSG